MDCEKLLQAAMSEMNNNQFEEAAKHFDMVVIENGVHPDAQFYRAYCKCHVGTLGDIPNQANIFTNAFVQYVNDIKNIEDVVVREAKMKDAVNKLSELTSYFSSNAKRTMFTAPSVGISINSAAKRMTDVCANAIKNSGIKVDSVSLENVNKTSRENNNGMKILIAIVAIGVIAFIIYEIITWSQINSIM